MSGNLRRATARGAMAATLLLAAVAGATSTALFAGYGPAPFGTRWEKALALFPQAEQLPANRNLGAPVVSGPLVHRLLLENQRVDGLSKPVRVELRFWKKKLWTVQVYYGENADAEVLAMLTTALGPSQGDDPDNLLWAKGEVETTAAPKQRWFGSADLGLSAEARVWFKKLMRGEWKRPSQADLDEMEDRTPAPGAAATPAGGHVH